MDKDEVVDAVAEHLVSKLSLFFKVQPHISLLKIESSTYFSTERRVAKNINKQPSQHFFPVLFKIIKFHTISCLVINICFNIKISFFSIA